MPDENINDENINLDENANLEENSEATSPEGETADEVNLSGGEPPRSGEPPRTGTGEQEPEGETADLDMPPAEAVAATDEPGSEKNNESKTAGAEPPIPLQASAAATKGGPSKYATPRHLENTPAARRLTYIVLAQMLLILVLGAFDVYLLLSKIPKLQTERDGLINDLKDRDKKIIEKTTRANEIMNELNLTLEEKNKITAERKYYEKKSQETAVERDNLASEKSRLEEELTALKKAHTKMEQELAETSGNLKNLEGDYKKVVDEKAGLEKVIVEKEIELSEVNKKYAEADAIIVAVKASQQISQEDWKIVYEQYKLAAPKIIDALSGVNTALQNGLTFKEFFDTVKTVEVPYQEFELAMNENTRKFLSYKLLVQAYNNYKETVERWKSLARLNPSGKAGSWLGKLIKIEDPVTTDTVWVMHLQGLWRESALYINAGTALIQTQEEFSYDKCPVCEGKHTFNCIKCNGVGTCVNCKGNGFNEIAGLSIPCEVCEGSSFCSLCTGNKVVICPVCHFATK